MPVLCRSTKGASKARRDHINTEIRGLRELLPITQPDKQRLSYLHTMALVNIFIRRTLYSPETIAERGDGLPPCGDLDFLQAIPGFIIAMTNSGKLVHVSENVSEYLGLSMIDLVSQGDSFYQMIDAGDQKIVRESLESATAGDSERSFLCRIHCSKSMRLQAGGHGLVLVRGRYVWPQGHPSARPASPLFTALCTPVTWPSPATDLGHCSNTFHSQHQADLRFITVSESVVYHLGYEREQLSGTSWYSFLHPADLSLSSSQHRRLLTDDGDDGVEMVARLQHRDSWWAWVYTRAHLGSATHIVECTHLVISESEALHVRRTLVAADPIVSAAHDHSRATRPLSRCTPRGVPRGPSQPRPSADGPRLDCQAFVPFDWPGDSLGNAGDVARTQGALFPASPKRRPADPPLDDAGLVEPAGLSEPLVLGDRLPPTTLLLPPTTLLLPPATLLLPPTTLLLPASCPGGARAGGETPPSTPRGGPYAFTLCPLGAVDAAGGFRLHRAPDAVSRHAPVELSYQGPAACQDCGQPPSGTDLAPAPALWPEARVAPQYTEQERTEINILAQQISCLAESFATYSYQAGAASAGEASAPTQGVSEWPDNPAQPWGNTQPQPLGSEPFLDAQLVRSILKEVVGEGTDPDSTGPAPSIHAMELGLCPLTPGSDFTLQDTCSGPFSSPSDLEEDFILEELAACESMFETWEAQSPNEELDHELHQLTDMLPKGPQQGEG
uniref:neuronal PAS domain-containing protein 4-like n=1 Tax=Pristiophorus japonicus TaxID=55135 RepID=UPI00398F436F